MDTSVTLIKEKEMRDRIVLSANTVTLTTYYADAVFEILGLDCADGYYHLYPPFHADGRISWKLMSGRVEVVGEGERLEVGDMIVLTHENESVYIRASEGARLLMHAYGVDAMRDTMKRFSRVCEVMERIQRKDCYTNSHSNRVHDLARKVGVRLGYTGNRLRWLLHAARFHDVGKASVPDSILNKPGPLTNAEWDIMRGHVLEGKALLQLDDHDELWRIIVQHHERLDGTGYPYGLQGQEISAEGRVLALVDTFDAMTSDRIYRSGKGTGEALYELNTLADIKYDGQVIGVLEQVLREDGTLI